MKRGAKRWDEVPPYSFLRALPSRTTPPPALLRPPRSGCAVADDITTVNAYSFRVSSLPPSTPAMWPPPRQMQAEVANLYQQWRDVRGLESPASAPTTPAEPSSRETSGGAFEGLGLQVLLGGARVAGGGGGKAAWERGGTEDEEAVALWRGDGVVLGVPNVLDAVLGTLSV